MEIRSLPQGPESINDFQTEAMAITEVVKIGIKEQDNFDGIVVDCCADPGVYYLKRILRIPVAGPCESSLAIASMVSSKIGIVTIGNKAVKVLEEKVALLNYKDKVIYIGSIPLGVAELDNDMTVTKKMIKDQIAVATSKGATLVVLGCTGFSGLAKDLQDETGVPIVDPIQASIKILEDLIEMRMFNLSNESRVKTE